VCVCVCVREREREREREKETGPRLAPAAVGPVLQVPLIPANFTQRSLHYLPHFCTLIFTSYYVSPNSLSCDNSQYLGGTTLELWLWHRPNNFSRLFQPFHFTKINDPTLIIFDHPFILYNVINPRIIENYTPTKCVYFVSHETEVALVDNLIYRLS